MTIDSNNDLHNSSCSCFSSPCPEDLLLPLLRHPVWPWRHQGEWESSKQKSFCYCCHPLAGATEWGTGYCPFWQKERKKKAENSVFQHLKWSYVPRLSREPYLEIFCYCPTCLVGNNYWSLLLKCHSGLLSEYICNFFFLLLPYAKYLLEMYKPHLLFAK